MKLILIFSLLLLWLPLKVMPDVVKPALTEISVDTEGMVTIEIRASIEALLTGINGQYKNTTESPNADHYDQLRVLSSNQLKQHFKLFEDDFIRQVTLFFDAEKQDLKLLSVSIPEAGYAKVPRTSVIILQSPISRSVQQLSWYYPNSFGDQAVRVRQIDRQNERWHWSDWQWIKTDKVSDAFILTEVFTQQSIWQVLKSYSISGFQHILPYGLDHILFIVGLFLFSRKLKPLLWQVTMFTVAHSCTLILATLGYIELSAAIVEPLIALSIAYIALETIFFQQLKKHRLAIIFMFGLLHGLGFASVLNDFGMPHDYFIQALLSFNLGVEIGQLTIVIIAWLLCYWVKSERAYRRFIVIPLSLSIACIALYWTWERTDWLSLSPILTGAI